MQGLTVLVLAAVWFVTLAAEGGAQVVIATRTLRPGQAIAADDVALGAQPLTRGLASDLTEVVGMEPRVTLYPGRPIPLSALQPPALVERNQLVTLLYVRGALEIRAEGRALGRAARDEPVRVLNQASRTTVTGRVVGPGLVLVP